MLRVFPILCALVLAALSVDVPGAAAQAFSDGELAPARSALAAARSGDLGRAYAEAATIKDPLLLKIVRWIGYSRPGGPGRFDEIADFIEKNPDWPRQKALRKHAEEALAGESDATAIDWLKRYPSVSAAGRVREAEIMLGSGDAEKGNEALRVVWIDGDLGPSDEKNFLARHSAAIRPEDSEKRLDRLLWDGQTEAARRMLSLVPADWRALAEARLALASGATNAEALIARVPAQLRSDPGLLYALLHWRTKKDMVDAAVQMFAISTR